MKTLLSIACVFLAATALAQGAEKDTAYKTGYADTAGFAQYGMRLYDARTYTYLPADTARQGTALNPYKFTAARKKKKHK